MTDIIVAGGGPAGLTAALYAVRAGRSVLVLEEAAPGGQINFSPLVENYPGLPGVSGLQLSEALTRQAEEQGVELDYAQVLGFRPEEGGFAVETDGGPSPLPRPDPRPWHPAPPSGPGGGGGPHRTGGVLLRRV